MPPAGQARQSLIDRDLACVRVGMSAELFRVLQKNIQPPGAD
jgi:hypothetical protein